MLCSGHKIHALFDALDDEFEGFSAIPWLVEVVFIDDDIFGGDFSVMSE